MPWIAVIAIGLLCMVVPFAMAQTRSAEQWRVVTFNVRCVASGDRDNNWPHRRALFIATLRRFDADLIGLQEVTSAQQDDIAAALPEYGSVYTARDDGARKGEASPIYFRRSRFELRSSGTFWLSETPEVAGSKGWDASLPRICTWARLHDRTTDDQIFMANAHFDHMGEQARVNAARLMAIRLPELAQGAAVIVTGDFNCTEDSPAYAALTRGGRLTLIDAFRALHPERTKDEATFHGFKGQAAGSRIDWLLHSSAFEPAEARIDRTKDENGRYPSDHYPVIATLRRR